MTTIEEVRKELERLYKECPNIHISVSMSHPKVSVREAPVKITGVYRSIFRIEEKEVERPRFFSLQYSDLLTGKIKIKELIEAE